MAESSCPSLAAIGESRNNMRKETRTILATLFFGALFVIIGLHSGERTVVIVGGSTFTVGIIMLALWLWLKYKGLDI